MLCYCFWLQLIRNLFTIFLATSYSKVALMAHWCLTVGLASNYRLVSIRLAARRAGRGRVVQEHKKSELKFNDSKEFLISDPGAFEFDPLEPVNLILFQKISNILTFILGLPFLITPERGEWEKGILQKWMRYRSFCSWGFQTGPFAAC